MEKECFYHHPKPVASKKPLNDNRTLQKKIFSIAQTATAEMEGLRVIRVAVEPNANCIVYYAAIAEYDVSSVENEISANTAHQIHMKQILCDFNVAATLIMA